MMFVTEAFPPFQPSRAGGYMSQSDESQLIIWTPSQNIFLKNVFHLYILKESVAVTGFI